MRLFKKHKAKDKLSLNVGIKECSTCDINLRCEECVYRNENENIKSEIEMLEIENQSLQVVANSYKLHYNETSAEAIKEFARKLKCGVPQETGVIRCADIDNLIKEMVGDKE